MTVVTASDVDWDPYDVGFNAEGIPPDVRIGPEVADPIQFIVDHYAKTMQGGAVR